MVLSAILAVTAVRSASAGIQDLEGALHRSGACFVLVDRSGSMNEKAPDATGRTKWAWAIDMASTLVRRLSLETDLWVAFFSNDAKRAETGWFSLDTEPSRRKVLDWIAAARRRPGGGTALWDVIDRALNEVDAYAADHPGAQVIIAVYTDWQDTASKSAQEERVLERLRGYRREGRNIWFTFVPLEEQHLPEWLHGEGYTRAPSLPIPIDVEPDRFVLSDPRGSPTQSIELVFRGSADALQQIEGREVTLRYEAAAGDSMDVEVEPTSAHVRRGRLAARLRVPGSKNLRSGDHKGWLRLRYPSPEGQVVLGPDRVGVVFRETPVELRFPSEGEVFAVGSPVLFEVDTLPDAQVTWILKHAAAGEDRLLGARVAHVFTVPGRVDVLARVELPGGSIDRKVTIETVEASLTIQPPPQLVVTGVPVSLHCSTEGDIRRVEWWVDGRRAVGSGRRGSDLVWTFASPGLHTVRSRGFHPRGEFSSQPLAVEVRPPPHVTLLDPGVAGSGPEIAQRRLRFGERALLRARTEGVGVQAVRFRLEREAGTLLADEQAAVSDDGTARLEVKLPMLWREERLSLTSSLILDPGVRKALGDALAPEVKAAWTAERSFSVDPPDLDGRLEIVVEPPEPRFGQEAGFTLHVDPNPESLGVREVEWSFDDHGEPGHGIRVLHRFGMVGTFHVTATATGPEGRRHVESIDVPVPLHSPIPDFVLRYGGERTGERSLPSDGSSPKATDAPRSEGSLECVRLGRKVAVVDRSKGDVAYRSLLVDGVPLGEGVMEFLPETVGTHSVEMVLTGPPSKDGTPPVTRRTQRLLRVDPAPRWGLFVSLAFTTIFLWLVLSHLLTRNRARSWSLHCRPPDRDEFEPAVFLSTYWDWWHKKARIPLSAVGVSLAPERAAESDGEDVDPSEDPVMQGELIVVAAPSSGGESSRARMEFTAGEEKGIDFSHQGSHGPNRVYSLTDRRRGLTVRYDFMVVEGRASVVPSVLFIAVTIAAAAGCYFSYTHLVGGCA